MKPSQVVLREYTEDHWQDRILTGEKVGDVEAWLRGVEARAPLAPGASGKPLAWLCFVDDLAGDPERKKVVRSVGLLTDVLRVLDRDVAADELQRLRDLFARDGRPFTGVLEY